MQGRLAKALEDVLAVNNNDVIHTVAQTVSFGSSLNFSADTYL